jgi:hypothetical protein
MPAKFPRLNVKRVITSGIAGGRYYEAPWPVEPATPFPFAVKYNGRLWEVLGVERYADDPEHGEHPAFMLSPVSYTELEILCRRLDREVFGTDVTPSDVPAFLAETELLFKGVAELISAGTALAPTVTRRDGSVVLDLSGVLAIEMVVDSPVGSNILITPKEGEPFWAEVRELVDPVRYLNLRDYAVALVV